MHLIIRGAHLRRPSLFAFSLPALCAALTLPAAAQSDGATPAGPPTQLETIIVTANPLGRTADDLVQPVSVLTGDELDAKRRATLGETLELEPGVSSTDLGTGAGRPVIRGLAGPRVEILDNGLSTMDVSDLSPDHAVALDTAHARQIEVLKGPSTLLYGNAASGGAINVKDDRLPDMVTPGFHATLEADYGSNGDARRTHSEFDYGVGEHQLHADFGWREASDYDIPGAQHADGDGPTGTLPNSFARARSGALSYSFVGNDGDILGLSYSRFETRYGLPFGHHAETPQGFIELTQNRYDVRGVLDQPLASLESLSLRLGYADYTHTEFEAPGVIGTVFDNEQVQGRLEAVHTPLAGLRGVVGVQFKDRDFQALGEEAYVPPVRSRSTGLFVVEELPVRFGRIEFGGRIERNQNDPQDAPARDFTPLSLAAGAVIDVGAQGHVKLYLTQSERSPVQEELYAFGPHAATATYERGNIDLGKERFDNIELGFDYHDGRWTLDASFFYNRARDYIYLAEVDAGLNADGSGTGNADGMADFVDEEGLFDPQGEFLLVDYRQADARLWGYELEVGYALLRDGPLMLTVNAFTDAVRGTFESGGNLPRITPRRHGLALEGQSGRIRAGLRYVRVDKQDRVAALETPTAGYDLVNADLSVRIFGAADHGDRAELYLRGTNLTDAEIRRHTSFTKDDVPAPGRSLYAGLRYVF
ncbi:iron complex outermembrane recepter protein [Fontimonas thermophila]|uniref:Iron complex outermembrane recepter protein n=1 Tax=Fontimonas thermophila TaxID=1076937 RepID=A0A1I2KEY2_9GAMM|nr:TonB-dependent receptor [Fontimonas thermophila]SFF63496.1 iron complex outermembrane recepter protein [Fontimonas thermophila]